MISNPNLLRLVLMSRLLPSLKRHHGHRAIKVSDGSQTTVGKYNILLQFVGHYFKHKQISELRKRFAKYPVLWA